jgi:hypothetical protein
MARGRNSPESVSDQILAWKEMPKRPYQGEVYIDYTTYLRVEPFLQQL